MLRIAIESHSLLDVRIFTTRFAEPIGNLVTTEPIRALADTRTAAAMDTSERIKASVRDLLRHGGFKPSGRSKPASEYLVAAAAEQRFPWLNVGVDICNVVSLRSGLPISLLDVRKLEPGPLAIRIAPPGTSYVFNPSGQSIDVAGLVCLFDSAGPTGTPVKDAQRTKTDVATRDTLTVVWGTTALPGRTQTTATWYRELLASVPATSTHEIECEA